MKPAIFREKSLDFQVRLWYTDPAIKKRTNATKPSPSPVLIRRAPYVPHSYVLFYADCPASWGYIGSREVSLSASGQATIGTFGEASIQFFRECPKASPEEQKRVLDAVAAYEGREYRLLQRFSPSRIRRNWGPAR